ncbi:hypothetical protein C480_05326 [Natrialba aegyptia DSM 13077]|uniref:Uncharacterized protein n=1 Tax=Natrialba aegyptia DSM 13077 TaxID=1227491 RepID=M0B980_9EURY|nr:hypothetical protein C480_05326 [Natrialba aegyptia DSM 13077]
MEPVTVVHTSVAGTVGQEGFNIACQPSEAKSGERRRMTEEGDQFGGGLTGSTTFFSLCAYRYLDGAPGDRG